MHSNHLHEKLLSKIKNCSETNSLARAEDCFWIACKYWELVKRDFTDKVFGSLEEEIDFFKNLKTKFTSQIQFFTMLCEVLMFVPSSKELQVEFWREELKRFKRFYDKNKVFIHYYESGCGESDSFYFVRVGPDWEPAQRPPSYDSDKNFCSTHDHLVRGYLSQKMYYEFVCKQLEKLGVKDIPNLIDARFATS